MKKYHHLYLRGNYRDDIFFDKVDFMNAWNRIWIAAFETGVKIMSVELLSNHFHVVIQIVDDKQVSEFVHYYRMSLSAYFNRRYDVSGSLGSRRYGKGNICDPMDDAGEDLRDAICYTLRNVAHHGITRNYRDWEFSTYKFVYDLADDMEIATLRSLPPNILRAYYPGKYEQHLNWLSTLTGMLIPPPSVFLRQEVEKLFADKAAYESKVAEVTRRESKPDASESKLGHETLPSEKSVSDQDIMDYIIANSRVSIVQMNRTQKQAASIACMEEFPNLSLRQLSRILRVPVSTIAYWRKKVVHC